ncbi:unnamed protein product [Phytomonas sp. EM1]|nr:unnamed protein product [Phytomonas sp. EM1]|eukprot:CCW61867.1 unnamed protein product [Phytomonas sp. isolate EM1]
MQPPMGYAGIKKKSTTAGGEKADAATRPPGGGGERGQAKSTPTPPFLDPRNPSRLAELRRREGTEHRRGIFSHIPFAALRRCLVGRGRGRGGPPAALNEGGGSRGNRTESPRTTAGSDSPRKSNGRFTPDDAVRARVLCSVRYKSYVEAWELRRGRPLGGRRFCRPFERWGVVNNLVRRISCAAAIYAWKILFSHTPHDDSKQTALHTTEERIARLERVRCRNQMILECYDVHSEREWMREACKDLSFVGHIWVPREASEKKDPYAAERCRQTFEFVEKFILQCFPVVEAVEQIPKFLLEAGIFFLVREVFNGVCDYEKTYIDADLFARYHPGLIASDHSLSPVDSTGPRRTPLTMHQRQRIQVYEQAVMLAQLVNWFSYRETRKCSEGEEALSVGYGGGGGGNRHPTPPQTQPLADSGEPRGAKKPLPEDPRAKTPETGLAQGEARSRALSLLMDSPPGRPHGVLPTSPGSLVKSLLTAFHVGAAPPPRGGTPRHVDMHPLKTPIFEAAGGGCVPNGVLAATGIRLVHLPACVLHGWSTARRGGAFLKERESELRAMLAAWLHTSSSKKHTTERGEELLVLYPPHFLRHISTQLAYVLLGTTASLEMCEDLECVEE